MYILNYYYRRALFFRGLQISRKEITREYISHFLNFIRENRNPVTPIQSRMYVRTYVRGTHVLGNIWRRSRKGFL